MKDLVITFSTAHSQRKKRVSDSFAPSFDSARLTNPSKISFPLSLRSTRNPKAGILWTSIIILASVLLGGCGTSQVKYDTHANAFLVKELSTKRIVMLADFGHSAPLPYKTLSWFLDKWVDQAAAGKTTDTNIVLVLEADKQAVDNLKSFVSDGNWKVLADYWLPYNTLEWFEFCSELRQLHLRIDSLNASKALSHKIHLDLFGGESYNVFDDPTLLRLSKKEGAKWFTDARDSLAANNIIAYLDSCRETRAIIFYGTNHLAGNYVHKNVAGDLSKSETGGYYLAHYLKKKFGRDSVLTVCQISPYFLSRQSPLFHAASDSDIYFSSSGASGEVVHLPGLQPRDFDAFITRKEAVIPGHPLRGIFSRNVVQSDIARLKFFGKYLPGALAERYYKEAMESLHILTGQDFRDAAEWERWFERTHYDGFRRIESRAFADQMIREFYAAPDSQKFRMELYSLGFRWAILDVGWTPTKTYWKQTLWPSAIEDIKLNDAIGLLWVGTAEEKRQAESYLVKKLGKPLREPQDYLKLLRGRLYDINY